MYETLAFIVAIMLATVIMDRLACTRYGTKLLVVFILGVIAWLIT